MVLAIEAPNLSELHERKLPLITIRLGEWFRVGAAKYPSVMHFGRGCCYRFDDPRGEYGVMYAGSNYLTCVAESVLRDELRTGARPLYLADLDERVIARLADSGEVQLVDCTEAIGIGLDNQIATVADYNITQAWSRALHDHPQCPDGLYYVSRNFPKGFAVALFERIQDRFAITEAPGSRVEIRKATGYALLLALLSKAGISLR